MLASRMGHQHSCLAECFFLFSCVKIKTFLEAGCSGNLLGIPLFHISLVWVLACCWLCALLLPEVWGLFFCYQVSLSFLKPAAPRKCGSNLAAPLQPRQGLLKLLLAKPLSKTQGPLWGSPRHLLAQAGVCSLPSAAWNGQYGSTPWLQMGPCVFQRWQKIPSWKKGLCELIWIYANLHQRKIQIINACTCSFSRSEYKV